MGQPRAVEMYPPPLRPTEEEEEGTCTTCMLSSTPPPPPPHVPGRAAAAAAAEGEPGIPGSLLLSQVAPKEYIDSKEGRSEKDIF